MAVSARLKGYRISARKARLVADQIRGKGVEDALNLLDFSDKKFARPLAKLVRSAVALDADPKARAGAKIAVDEGTRMWRIRPRAQGRATWIQKPSSHVTVVLEEK